MLREVKAREESAEGNRRWFADDYFELIVWLDERSTVASFQLCYDRRRWQRALTWTKANGLRHDSVDDGESSALKNQTPLYREGGEFDRADVLRRFQIASVYLPGTIAEFVEAKIAEELA